MGKRRSKLAKRSDYIVRIYSNHDFVTWDTDNEIKTFRDKDNRIIKALTALAGRFL